MRKATLEEFFGLLRNRQAVAQSKYLRQMGRAGVKVLIVKLSIANLLQNAGFEPDLSGYSFALRENWDLSYVDISHCTLGGIGAYVHFPEEHLRIETDYGDVYFPEGTSTYTHREINVIPPAPPEPPTPPALPALAVEAEPVAVASNISEAGSDILIRDSDGASDSDRDSNGRVVSTAQPENLDQPPVYLDYLDEFLAQGGNLDTLPGGAASDALSDLAATEVMYSPELVPDNPSLRQRILQNRARQMQQQGTTSPQEGQDRARQMQQGTTSPEEGFGYGSMGRHHFSFWNRPSQEIVGYSQQPQRSQVESQENGTAHLDAQFDKSQTNATPSFGGNRYHPYARSPQRNFLRPIQEERSDSRTGPRSMIR